MSLISLHIRDFAIISELDIEFRSGFTVFSGETGAGKSILFDALGLCLGERADSGVIRSGAERTEITACFTLEDGSPALTWLDEQGLQDPDEPGSLQLRRQIRNGGQSRGFINGSPVNLTQLRELGELLIDIHGQHAHQSLLRPGEQRRLLDAFAGHEPELAELGAVYRALQDVERRLLSLSRDGTDTSQKQELLRYQLEELDQLAPTREDFDALEVDFRRLDQADALLQHAATASQILYTGDSSLYDQLAVAMSALDAAARIDARFESARELCEQIQIQLKEAASSADDLAADVDPDPEELARLSQRLDTYQSLARKHRVRAEDLPAHWDSLRAELQGLEGSAQDEATLKARREALLAQYAALSDALSAKRKKASEDLGKAITTTVQPLGLPHAQCDVAVTHKPDTSPQPHGQDAIEIRIAMNPGQAAAPLAKVASGGELARTSLAIQVVCLNQSPVPILLFDEVDVGIGGGVAEVVGRRLKELAGRYQVFCVTHQPQVASLAHTHFAVSKSVSDGQTRTGITELTATQRVEELARMLGGMRITEQTRAHAQEMLTIGQD